MCNATEVNMVKFHCLLSVCFVFLSKAMIAESVHGCNVPLGLETGGIHDRQLSASSYYSSMYLRGSRTKDMLPKYGRLNGQFAWCSRGPNRRRRVIYFQVEFKEVVNVTGVATQGLKRSQNYVQTYQLKFSTGGKDWFSYSSPNKDWSGNTNGDSVVRKYFDRAVRARFIRVYPKKFRGVRCMRVEIYGCGWNVTDAVSASTTKPQTFVSSVKKNRATTVSTTKAPSTVPGSQAHGLSTAAKSPTTLASLRNASTFASTASYTAVLNESTRSLSTIRSTSEGKKILSTQSTPLSVHSSTSSDPIRHTSNLDRLLSTGRSTVEPKSVPHNKPDVKPLLSRHDMFLLLGVCVAFCVLLVVVVMSVKILRSRSAGNRENSCSENMELARAGDIHLSERCLKHDFV